MHVAQPGLIGHVERGALMRILSVAERLLPPQPHAQRGRQRLLRARQVAQDRGVVRRGVRENFRGERTPFILGNLANLEILDHARVVIRIDNHNHIRMVLRG